MRGKRIGSTVLCLALLLSLFPCTAFASAGPTLSVGDKTYALQTGSCRMPDCDGGYARYFYSDGYFAAPSAQYNEHLATMSLNLAMTAAEFSGGDYIFHHANVRRLLADIGCDDDTIRVNDEALVEPTEDSIAFTMGHKKLAYADGTETGALLLPVAVRGAGYGLEWCSNFTIGASGEATGFASAANRVCAGVEEYLADFDLLSKAESGQVKFWLVGYSRGAAVANLAAKRLADKYGDAAVYAYTWETPMGGVASAEMTERDYSGIHNICNYADIVTLVAPEKMGFKRYGTDRFFPSADAEEYAQQVAAMKDQLYVVAPDAEFDGSFTLAAMSMHSVMSANITNTPIYPVFFAHSDSVNHFAGDYLRLLLEKLQDSKGVWKNNILTSRQNYASRSVRLGRTSYPTVQETITSLIAIAENTDTVPTDVVADAFKELSKAPGFAVWLGALYTDVLMGWNDLTDAKKLKYINDCWDMLESSGMLEVFDKPTRDTLKRVWPTVACTLFPFTSADSATSGKTLGYSGVEDKFILTATLAQNAATLAVNHIPVYTLAWARSFDSYYADELTPCGKETSGTLTAPVLSVSGGTLTLDVPTTRGEIICYTFAPLGASDGAPQLYRGGIDLPVEADTVYRLTAYAVYDGKTSAEVTYYLPDDPYCLIETQRTDSGIAYRAECVNFGEGATSIIAAAYRDGRLTKTVCLDGPALSGGSVSGTIPLSGNDGTILRVFFLDALGRPLTDAR